MAIRLKEGRGKGEFGVIFRTIGGKIRPMKNLTGIKPSPTNRDAMPEIRNDYKTIRSFVTPNAKCPVCGQAVWFYRSPYDGKVFFDEIGPPWPKHPCTDNEVTPISGKGFGHLERQKRYLLSRKSLRDRKNLKWHKAGWRPVFRVRLNSLDPVTLKLRFSIRPNGERSHEGYLDKREIGRSIGSVDLAIQYLRRGLVFYRVENGKVTIALLGGNLHKHYFPAYRYHQEIR